MIWRIGLIFIFLINYLTGKYFIIATRCYTDSCDPEDSACLLGGDTCLGNLCFLDLTGSKLNYKKINRGCLDKEFLKNEGEGCFIINPQSKSYFCQCYSDFCNGQIDYKRLKNIGDGRNVSCDTGCNARGRPQTRSRLSSTQKQSGTTGRHHMICNGKTNGGPFCSFDPQNRGNPKSEYGESYYTPFGSFYGWPEENSTICLRYTFPPFYFIRDAACFCDTDNCNRPVPSMGRNQEIDNSSTVTCHGCFLDCNSAQEFCGPYDQICKNESTCVGHYCVTHVVTDRYTINGNERLAVLSQYCMNSTQFLNGSRHEMTFNSGRNGRTRVIVCNGEDYCNGFNITDLIIGVPPQIERLINDENNLANVTISNYALSTPNTGRMMKLRKLLNYLLESLLSPNVPW